MAKVLSSISGNLISAASAGYAPTNSADVSAIASAYQVVSATGTQLYVGTAHVTSINSAPISASRAGNAANASLANSAWYDGTGRLISSLPDSATVSAIASSYAKSSVSGVEATVSANSASWAGGGTALPIEGTYINISDDYGVEVSASDGQNTASYNSRGIIISGIGDSAFTTIHPDAITLSDSIDWASFGHADVLKWNSAVDTVSSNSASWGGGGGDTYWSATEDSAFVGGFGSNLYGSGSAVSIGWDTTAKNTSVAIGVYGNSAYNSAIAIGAKNSADYGGVAIGAGNQTRTDGVSIGKGNTAYGANNRIIGTDNSAKYNSEVFGTSNRADDGITIGGHNSASGGIAIGYRLKMSGHNGLAVGQFNARSSDTLFVIGDGSLDGRSDALYVDLSGGLSAKGKISANGVELGAGVDSATVSAIASSYAESAASSKAYASALSSYALSADVSGAVNKVTNSSGYWDAAVTKLNNSGDAWNSAYNTVSANSASWGGGATGDYVETSATEVAIGSDNSASSYSFAQGSGNSAVTNSFAQGYRGRALDASFAQGRNNNVASATSFAQGESNKATSYSFAQGRSNSASSYSFAQGLQNSASNASFAQGLTLSAIHTAAVFGKYNLRGDGSTAASGDSAAFVIGDGMANTARHDLMVVTKDGEITMYSSTADTTGTGIMSAIRAISAAATGGGGGIDSATCSAIASSYAESAVSSRMYASAMQVVTSESLATATGVLYIVVD